MTEIRIPELYCPFPSAVNSHAEAVNQHTLAWVRRFNLVPNENDFSQLIASKFGWLAARAYPNAALDELRIVSDWNTWLFIRDDQCDESGLGHDPASLAKRHDRLLEILAGCAPTLRDSPLAHALYDLRGRLECKASRGWMGRFIHSVVEYFESSVWEARNRASKVTPDPDTYITMRPYTGGLYTDIELIDITERIYLPLHVRKHRTVQDLALMANNVVCWSNDIISFFKEIRHNDVHNLVVSLRHHHRLTLQEAIDRAAELTDGQVRAFMALQEKLPCFSPSIDADLRRFVAVLRSWMRGNLDWAYASGRYQLPTAETG
jgi:hypothetical protein